MQGAFSRFQTLEREVKLGLVVCLHQQVAHLHADEAAIQEVAKSVKVAQTFGHLLVIDDEMLRVHPHLNERLARARLRLSDLVLVMRKHVVDAAAMNV